MLGAGELGKWKWGYKYLLPDVHETGHLILRRDKI
jgi:hypothetical protein